MLVRIDQQAIVLGDESQKTVDRTVNKIPATNPRQQGIIVGNNYLLKTRTGALATIVFRGYTIGFFKLPHGIYPTKAIKNAAQWEGGQNNRPWLILDPVFVGDLLSDQIEKIMEESYWERMELILTRQHTRRRVGIEFLPETIDIKEILVVVHYSENCSSSRIIPVE